MTAKRWKVILREIGSVEYPRYQGIDPDTGLGVHFQNPDIRRGFSGTSEKNLSLGRRHHVDLRNHRHVREGEHRSNLEWKIDAARFFEYDDPKTFLGKRVRSAPQTQPRRFDEKHFCSKAPCPSDMIVERGNACVIRTELAGVFRRRRDAELFGKHHGVGCILHVVLEIRDANVLCQELPYHVPQD